MRVGIVDVQRVISESESGKKARERVTFTRDMLKSGAGESNDPAELQRELERAEQAVMSELLPAIHTHGADDRRG